MITMTGTWGGGDGTYLTYADALSGRQLGCARLPDGAYYIAQSRGVIWDRIAWAWRAQDGAGNSSTHDTWSEANAWLDGAAGYRMGVTVTWADDDYPPEGRTVDLSTFFPESWGLTKAPRKPRRKGKRK